METRLKMLTAISIPYVFLCAGLYHIAFWTPFGINIFPFLDLADIVKSIISPLFYSSFTAMFVIFIQYSRTFDFFPYGGGNIEPANNRKKIIWSIIKLLYLFLILFLLLIFEDKWKGQFLPWIMAPGLYYVAVEFLLKKGIMEHNKYNFLAMYVLILLPIFSFVTGTINARKIYENKDYEYNTSIIPEKTLKLLAKASDHYVFVSLDNKDRYFYAVDEIKELKLNEFKSK